MIRERVLPAGETMPRERDANINFYKRVEARRGRGIFLYRKLRGKEGETHAGIR